MEEKRELKSWCAVSLPYYLFVPQETGSQWRLSGSDLRIPNVWRAVFHVETQQ